MILLIQTKKIYTDIPFKLVNLTIVHLPSLTVGRYRREFCGEHCESPVLPPDLSVQISDLCVLADVPHEFGRVCPRHGQGK